MVNSKPAKVRDLGEGARTTAGIASDIEADGANNTCMVSRAPHAPFQQLSLESLGCHTQWATLNRPGSTVLPIYVTCMRTQRFWSG